MSYNSKEEIESAVSQAMSKFLKEQMGEETDAVTTEIIGDTIIVRIKGTLPPAERNMIKTQEGIKLIRELKEKLVERAKPLLEALIKDLTNTKVIDIHSSLDVEAGECIEVFRLNKNLGMLCRS
ncbi:MAG: DUF2294 domain-containing protein [Candidatus Omnitrophota bacterium]